MCIIKVMEELMDLLVKDESPSEISDKIKDVLFANSPDIIEAIKPVAAASLFGQEAETPKDEIENEVTEVEPESEEN